MNKENAHAYYLRTAETMYETARKRTKDLDAIFSTDPDARKIYFPSHPDLFMLVHKDDLEFLNTFRWRLHWKGYAQSYHTKPQHGVRNLITLKAHRLVLQAPPRQIVDHRNGNTLDNRRCNLRFASAEQNLYSRRIGSRNTSGFLGVRFRSDENKWIAHCFRNYRHFHLGQYALVSDAVLAADMGRLMAHGIEWASLNNPKEVYKDFLGSIEGVDFTNFTPADFRLVIKAAICKLHTNAVQLNYNISTTALPNRKTKGV